MKININRFLGQNVDVIIYDGTEISGKLVGIDRSKKGALGNLILSHSQDLTIIRGDSVQSVALSPMIWVSKPIYDQIDRIAKDNGIDVGALVNGILELALDRVENGLMEVTKRR